MPRFALALTLAAAGMLAGCGGGGSNGSSASTGPVLPPDRVVATYRRAAWFGHGALACAQLTDEARAVAEQGTGDCAGRFNQLAANESPQDHAREIKNPARVVVLGDAATATWRSDFSGDQQKIELRKVGGRWKVSSSPEIENFRISNGG